MYVENTQYPPVLRILEVYTGSGFCRLQNADHPHILYKHVVQTIIVLTCNLWNEIWNTSSLSSVPHVTYLILDECKMYTVPKP